MLKDIIKIAFLCIVIGSASIPVGFTITKLPEIVYIGNVLGSVISALFVVIIGDKIKDKEFRKKMNRHRPGKKIVTVFEQGENNKKVMKARVSIDKHGLRFFSFFCPIFPGVLIASIAVYVLDLDRTIYKKWMFSGILFACGMYVYGYWWIFIR